MVHKGLYQFIFSFLLLGFINCEDNSRYLIEKEGLFGFIDNKGNEVIKPLFIGAEDFENNITIAETNVCYQIIDSNGNIIKEIESDEYILSGFNCGLSLIYSRKLKKFGFLDYEGNIVIPIEWLKAEKFHSGYAVVSNDEKNWYYIDSNGKIVNPGNPFDYAFSFCGDIAFVMKKTTEDKYVQLPGMSGMRFISGNRFGVLNSSFRIIFPFDLVTAHTVTNDSYQNLIGWEQNTETCSFFSVDGLDTLLSYRFRDAKPFTEGLGAVLVDGKWGFIDRNGSIKISAKYMDVGFFSEGLCWVIIDDNYGYINKDGSIVVDAQYDLALPFKQGLAYVKKGEDIFYIDKTGLTVWSSLQ